MRRKNIKLIELFAGIGAQNKALTNLGYNVNAFTVEFDKSAVDAYNAIHKTNEPVRNILHLQAKDLPKNADFLTYSFPCQDLSNLGGRHGWDEDSKTRSSLAHEVLRLLKQMNYTERPTFAIMENVPAITNKTNKTTLYAFYLKLTELGYTSYAYILNAKDFGVPQQRARYFLVSYKTKTDANIAKFMQHCVKFQIPYLHFHTADFLRSNYDEMTKACIKNLPSYVNYVKKSKVVNPKKNDIFNTILTHQHTYPNAGILPFCYDLDIYLPYRWVTPRDCFNLMGFTCKDFDSFKASDAVKYKLAGNSIVVNVLEHLFKHFLDKW